MSLINIDYLKLNMQTDKKCGFCGCTIMGSHVPLYIDIIPPKFTDTRTTLCRARHTFTENVSIQKSLCLDKCTKYILIEDKNTFFCTNECCLMYLETTDFTNSILMCRIPCVYAIIEKIDSKNV